MIRCIHREVIESWKVSGWPISFYKTVIYVVYFVECLISTFLVGSDQYGINKRIQGVCQMSAKFTNNQDATDFEAFKTKALVKNYSDHFKTDTTRPNKYSGLIPWRS